MRSKGLFEKYKGKVAIENMNDIIIKGIICGYVKYSKNTLIVAVENTYGWNYVTPYDVIVTHINNKSGYWYVSKKI